MLAACTGQIALPTGAPIDTTPPSTNDTSGNGYPAFAPTTSYQLRRLTTEQYVASVETLLGVSAQGMPPIEPVAPVAGYTSIGAATTVVSSDGVAQFEATANFLAAAAMTSSTARAQLLPCTPSSVSDTACFTQFAGTFGQRAFRRPLTTTEVAAYSALTAQVAMSTGDPLLGVQSTVSAFLQSPNFLYLPELGEPDPVQPGRLRYTDYEMASRLSFFLTNQTPDDQLLAAAGNGELTTVAGVDAQVDRLLAAPGAHDAMKNFFTAMLSLDGLDGLARSPAAFPQFTPTLAGALKQQTLLTFDDLIFSRDADYHSVFTDQSTFVNAELATFYGLTPPTSGGFVKLMLPSGPRVGLLGQAGVLLVHDHSEATSPTKRGLFVLTKLLCQPLALAPPAGLTIPPPPTGKMTARQRLTQHATAGCSSCHTPMDSVGLSLEHFDALGVWRDQDQGLAIDDSGQLGGVSYQGEAGLSSLVASHRATDPCLVQALYGASVGHVPSEFDRDGFKSLVTGFDAGGSKIKPLLKAITESDGFRYAPAPN